MPRKSALFLQDFNIDDVVCRGYLLKKNRWFSKQLRFFQLLKNGDLKYFKDFKYKGKLTLTKDTRVVKTGRNLFEIPQRDKVYTLIEIDKKDIGDIKIDPT